MFPTRYSVEQVFLACCVAVYGLAVGVLIFLRMTDPARVARPGTR